jgi:hypothetical protein
MAITKYEFSALNRFQFNLEWLNIGVYFQHSGGDKFDEVEFNNFMIGNRIPFAIRDVRPTEHMHFLTSYYNLIQYYNQLLSVKNLVNSIYLGLDKDRESLWILNQDELIRYVDYFEDWVIFPFGYNYQGFTTQLRLQGKLLEEYTVGEFINMYCYIVQQTTPRYSLSLVSKELKAFANKPHYRTLKSVLSRQLISKELETFSHNLLDWFSSYFGEHIRYIQGVPSDRDIARKEVDMTLKLRLFAFEYGNQSLPITKLTRSLFNNK